MTKRQKQLKLDALVNLLTRHEFKEDRYGNYKRTVKVEDPVKLSCQFVEQRIKIQATSIRFEVKQGSSWIRVRSGYIKNLELLDDEIKGMINYWNKQASLPLKATVV